MTERNIAQKDVDAAVLFDKHCDTCHGKDGQAKTFKAKFNHARNLTDAKWQSEVSDQRLFNSISNGKGNGIRRQRHANSRNARRPALFGAIHNQAVIGIDLVDEIFEGVGL